MYFDKAFIDCKYVQNIDYFGHAWNTETCTPINFYKEYDHKKVQQNLQDTYQTSNIVVDDYHQEFKKLASVYKNNSSLAENIKRGIRLNQWRSFEKATRILNKINKDYDLIICTRYDIVYQPVPEILKRVIDIINNAKNAVKNEDIIVTDGSYSENTNNISMQDLVFFGTKDGIIKFGKNFTRNRIKQMFIDLNYQALLPTLNTVEQKLLKKYIACKGFRDLWGLQIIESKVTRRTIDKIGKIIIARSGCPSLDINTIEKYSNYYLYYKHKRFLINELKHIRDWWEYDPNFDYR